MAQRKVTRLRFTKNELTDEKVRRAAAKAERAADRAEAAQSKLPQKAKLRIIREAAGVKTPGSKLQQEKTVRRRWRRRRIGAGITGNGWTPILCSRITAFTRRLRTPSDCSG